MATLSSPTQTQNPVNPIKPSSNTGGTSTTGQIGEGVKQGLSTVKNFASSFANSSADQKLAQVKNLLRNPPSPLAIHWFGISILIVVLIWLITYISTKLNLGTLNCNTIAKVNNNVSLLNSSWISNANSPSVAGRNLRDFYIKTAYNCCASGDFKNDYVSICALQNAIRQGCRCLDFEIYCLENAPVVATSSVNKLGVKETYNALPLGQVLSEIANLAFSQNATTIVGKNQVVPMCPNPDDPLLLHFRFKTEDVNILNMTAAEIAQSLGDRLMPIQYMKENDFTNFTATPIYNCKGKVIIMVEKHGGFLYKSKNMFELTNVTTNSVFVREMTFFNVKNVNNINELEDFNRQNMTIVLPDLSPNNNNYPSIIPAACGCQFMAMNFQNLDDNLIAYNKMFDNVESAFCLRPESLLYIPVTIPAPPPPNPNLSYEPRILTVADGLITLPI